MPPTTRINFKYLAPSSLGPLHPVSLGDPPFPTTLNSVTFATPYPLASRISFSSQHCDFPTYRRSNSPVFSSSASAPDSASPVYTFAFASYRRTPVTPPHFAASIVTTATTKTSSVNLSLCDQRRRPWLPILHLTAKLDHGSVPHTSRHLHAIHARHTRRPKPSGLESPIAFALPSS